MRQRFLWGLGICYDETFLENDTGVGLDLNFGPRWWSRMAMGTSTHSCRRCREESDERVLPP